MPRRLRGTDLDSWSRPRIWLAGFLTYFALSAAWALATPLTNVPDEPAHIVKAAATVRGESKGVLVEFEGEVGGIPTTQFLTGYKVPAGYARLLDMHTCYFLNPHVPASCAAPMPDRAAEAVVGTSAGGNNPLFYAAVGWPSLISHGEGGIYAMRLVSAALCSALLAGAVVTLVEWRRRRGLLLLGLAAAATPTAMFLNGSVNPNGIEVSAATLVWCALLSLFADPRPELVARRVTRAAIAAATVVEVRSLGPVWIVGILAVTLLVGEPGTLRSLLRRRAIWIGAAVVAAATMGAFAWSVHSNVLITSANNYPELTFLKAAHFSWNHSGLYLDSQIGLFGWLDYAPPLWGTREIWKALLVGLAILAFVAGRRREKAAVVGLLAAIIAIPIAAQSIQAPHLGYIWQGRYLMAVSAGLPILTTMILARRPVAERTRRFATRRWMLGVTALFLADALVIFYSVFHRYAMGDQGPWIGMHTQWAPPGGFLFTVALYLLGTGLLGWLILAATPLRRDSAGSEAPVEARRVTRPRSESRILSSVDDR